MGESLIQRRCMSERRRYRCKALSSKKIMTVFDIRSPGKFCASSRGNTGGAGVIHTYWAYRVCRHLIKLTEKFLNKIKKVV